LLAGILFAVILYYRNRSSEFSGKVLIGLSLLRFLAVSLLAFLLLSPLLQRMNRYVEDPLVIFLQDNSRSLISGKDSVYFRSGYIQERRGALDQLEGRFDVRHFHFGEMMREGDSTDYNDRITDISAAFEELGNLFSNRNVGAVILASDGIFNRGSNPVFFSEQSPYPIYTMALGDTIPRRDLILKRINHNRLTYLGNQFPVEVEVEAQQLAGKTTRLTVSKEGVTLFSKNLTFNSDLYLETILLELEAESPGVQRYSLELSPVEGEISLTNNVQDFFIEVIDSRQKVLILSNSSHPDIGAIRMALEESDNYEISSFLVDEFDGVPEAYNLIIFHQLPSQKNPVREILQRLESQGIPSLFVIGAQTHFPSFNQLRTGLTITPRSGEFSEALPILNKNFPLFSVGEDLTSWIGQLPPLNTPFASYQVGSGVNVMFFQKIGTVETEQPLVLFSENGERKNGVITGEGIWRWRIRTFAQMNSHNTFDAFLWRTVQYLSLKEDKNFFRVTNDHFYYETDPVVFEAELYNPSYELVNEPSVEVTITNEEDVDFRYEMGRTSQAYRLDAGTFPPGDYFYQVRTRYAGEPHEVSGQFSVSALNIEGLKHVADHNTLFQIAENTGGEMFYPGQWDLLEEAILSREDILPVMYSQKEFHELINLRIVFAILLLLLAVEWFTRKWNGSF
jgi:hypothetical protein